MATNIITIPMQHPFKKDRNGMPFIQKVNAKTVKSGKAAKLGYIPVPQSATPPPTTAPKANTATTKVTPTK